MLAAALDADVVTAIVGENLVRAAPLDFRARTFA
jgi:hypothetical protein